MINNTGDQAVRQCLKESLAELAALEDKLLKDLEKIKKYTKGGSDESSVGKYLNQEDHLVAMEVQPLKPLNPKLAQEKEKEIIEAIMRAKEAIGDNLQDRTEEFEYRPEGMFPELPKPLNKKDKIELLNKAYGVKPKAPPKPVEKVKKIVKPSESKYTFKGLGKNIYERNPQKITTQGRPSSRGKPNVTTTNPRNSSRGASVANRRDSVDKHNKPPITQKRKPINRRDDWQDLAQKPAEVKAPSLSEAESTQLPQLTHTTEPGSVIEVSIPNQQPSNFPSVRQSMQKLAPQTLNPFEGIINKARGRSSVGRDEVSWLNSITSLVAKGRRLAEEYTRTVGIELKRQKIDVCCHKMLETYALQSAANAVTYEAAIRAKRDKSESDSEDLEDETEPGHVKTSRIPRLTKLFLDPREMEDLQLSQMFTGITQVPSAFDCLNENDELMKIKEFEKRGYFSKTGDEYEDMVALLSGKGVKSPYGQEILADMYACWFGGEQFATVYSQLKDKKSVLENTIGKIMQSISKPEVLDVLKHIEVVVEDEKPLTDVEAVEQDTSLKTLEMQASYLNVLKNGLMKPLKAKFDQMVSAEKQKGTEWEPEQLKSYLKKLQELDRLIKPNSRLPLLFHTNFTPEIEDFPN